MRGRWCRSRRASRWPSPSRRGVSAWRSTTSTRMRWRRINARRGAVPRAGHRRSRWPRRSARAAQRRHGPRARSAPPSTWSWWSARRSTSTSTPTRRRSRARWIELASPPAATVSCSCCAAPSTRASPRRVERLLGARRPRRRRRVLPRAHRRGQGDDRAVRAAADRGRRAPPRAATRAAELFRQPDRRRSSTLEPEEAELAKLFTNTWRYIKFAAANQFYMMANDFGLDFERIRAAHDARLPARRRHARAPGSPPGRACSRTRCSWRVQRQQLRARPLRDAGQRGPARSTWSRGSSSAYDLSTTDRRHPRHGVQGRERRHPLEPDLQAQAAAAVQGRARAHAPTPTSRRRPGAAPARGGARPSPTCSSSAPRTRCTATSRPTLPVVDVWNLRGAGSRV